MTTTTFSYSHEGGVLKLKASKGRALTLTIPHNGNSLSFARNALAEIGYAIISEHLVPEKPQYGIIKAQLKITTP